MPVPDGRYTVNEEFTGDSGRPWVARFCGDFISAHATVTEALSASQSHHFSRLHPITPEEVGTWLDGAQGWYNTYRVIDLAMEYGFSLTLAETEAVAIYAKGDPLSDPNGEAADIVSGQGGLSDRATDFLQSLCPAGLIFEWDAGELSLRPYRLCLHCQNEEVTDAGDPESSLCYACLRDVMNAKAVHQ